MGRWGAPRVATPQQGDGSHPALFPLLLFGLLAGAGGATFSVGIPQTSHWFPARRQGLAIGVYSGAGNIEPGIFNLFVVLDGLCAVISYCLKMFAPRQVAADVPAC